VYGPLHRAPCPKDGRNAASTWKHHIANQNEIPRANPGVPGQSERNGLSGTMLPNRLEQLARAAASYPNRRPSTNCTAVCVFSSHG
jgi:hypothetical protein